MKETIRDGACEVAKFSGFIPKVRCSGNLVQIKVYII